MMATHWSANQVVLMTWLLMLGVCASRANGTDCRVNISGPIVQGIPYKVRVMPANNTHAAVVHCRAVCLNSGEHIPAMGIILTELGKHKEARTGITTEKGLYNITYESIQSCDLSNNIGIMEFRYSFYPLSAMVDRTVLTCGVVQPVSLVPCWAQSYAVIHYTFNDPITTTPPDNCTTTLMPTSTGSEVFKPSVSHLVTVFSPLVAILAVALAVVILIAIFEGVFIAVRVRHRPLHCRRNRIHHAENDP